MGQALSPANSWAAGLLHVDGDVLPLASSRCQVLDHDLESVAALRHGPLPWCRAAPDPDGILEDLHAAVIRGHACVH